MMGMEYWIATVSNDDGLHASDLIWGDGEDPDSMYGQLSMEVKHEAARLGVAVEWFGPLILPAAA